jgi:hypothetical protein
MAPPAVSLFEASHRAKTDFGSSKNPKAAPTVSAN